MKDRIVAVGLILGTLCSASTRGQDAEGLEFFEKHVRPVLAERCWSCHEGEDAKAGLDLTSREKILAGGSAGAVVEEENPGESYLIEVLRYVDEPRMPPDGKLKDSEIEALAEWLRRGMPWPASAPLPAPSSSDNTSPGGIERPWWAIPPAPTLEPPAVRGESWVRTPVDRFILSRLEAEGLGPAPEADRRTLIRRLYFDLVGLPPSPEAVEAFVQDPASDAYERLVEDLLASPAHGERWARHWLDVVRYADSLDTRGSGQPGDILDAWRYRDWVVNALNADLPYDRFVQMQIAGDVMPPASPEEGEEGFNRAGTIATTMLAIGNWGNGDADKEKILTDIADDQVDVVSKAFLGLTVSCARCHDHKFDPISQEDYYGLAGIFFSTHILPELTPKGAGETIARVALASPAEQERREQHAQRLAELEKKRVEIRAELARTLATSKRAEAGRYVLAAFESMRQPGTDLDAFATSRGLHPVFLRRWVDALVGTEIRRLDRRVENVGGVAGVSAWNGPEGSASASANPFDVAHKILTFTLPARSISVHPGPESAAVVAWTSPINGHLRLTGQVADGDAACGDGFAWSLEHRSIAGTEVLATGELSNGGAMALAQAQNADRLSRVAVSPGDRIELVIHRRGDYSCDTTTVDLVLSCWENADTWDLTRDTLENFSASNPMPDRAGHPDVWSFGDAPRSAATARPELAAARGQWRDAVSRGDDPGALQAAAQAMGEAMASEDANSPFWVESDALAGLLAEADRETMTAVDRELETLRQVSFPPLEYANAAQEGGVPRSPHAGTHDVAVHLRGRYDRLGPVVPRRFPIVLAGEVKEQARISEGSGRKELAEWLTRPDHPLTPRVMVNRVWQHHCGRGLSGTPSNFGKLGEAPSHPELLDWLAVQFVRDGWSLKALHRTIVLSATYRQASTPSTKAIEVDPENRWLSHGNRRRLEAETLRDFLLSAAGTLDSRRGGPAERDFQAPRRGLYMITIRSDRATYGALFDQADPTAPVDRRVESTVAPQALWLLNSPFVLAQAERLADRLLAEVPGDDPGARIDRAYAILFARPPEAEERTVAIDLLGAAPASRTAWVSLAQVLMSTNSFMYVD